MDKILMDAIERATNSVKNSNKELIKLGKIGLVIRMYQQGAEAESCMQRIVNIFIEDLRN